MPVNLLKVNIAVVVASFFALQSPALAQQPPGGGGGGGAGPATTLSSLGCRRDQIARVNGADEWECSADLNAAEVVAFIARTTANQAVIDAANAQATANTAVSNAATAQSTANTAVSAAAAAQSTANSAQSRADGAVGDAAAAQSAADGAQVTADGALAIGSDALSRVETLEGQNVEARISSLEQAVFPLNPIPGGNLAGLDLGSRAFNDPIDVDGFAPGVNFAGSFASGFARFVGTDLRGANFSGIGGSATWTFEFADIRGTDFSGSTAREIRLTASDNRGISFVGSVLGRQGVTLGDNSGGVSGNSRDMDFRNTRINGPLLSMVSGDRSDFSGSVWFSSGSFSTNLKSGSCRECKFNGVDFSGWNAFGTGFEIDIINAQDTEWRGANLQNLGIRGTNFQRADFRGANLENAEFVNMNFEGALFSGANLVSVTWQNVRCPDGILASSVGGTCEFNLID